MRLLEKTWLKVLSYILLPILLIGIIFSVAYLEYLSYNDEYLHYDDFYETPEFCDTYMRNITNLGFRYKDYIGSGYNEYNTSYTDIYYLIIDNATGNYYTNYGNAYESGTDIYIKELKDKGAKYLRLENGKLETNVNISENDKENIKADFKGCTLYTAFVDSFSFSNRISIERLLFDISKGIGTTPLILLPFLIILFFLSAVYLVASIGHKKGKEGINLYRIDKLPLEISSVGIGFIVFLVILSLNILVLVSNNMIETALIFIALITVEILYYIVFATLVTIIIKQIKAKIFIKQSICYRVCHGVYSVVTRNIGISTRVALVLSALGIASLILISWGGFGIVLFLALWMALIYALIKYTNQIKEISDFTEQLYKGNTQSRLDEEKFMGENKRQVIYLNDIAGGFSNAISEKLKSERLKTELITNVSHDLKTPLTSIINYVDLLKGEDIGSQKAKEYIGVLDNKSQRLKKLTEDLVEASKASTGTLKLNMEKIEVIELITQILGEFEDKFKKAKLEIVTNFTKEKVYIMADNRYIYRVFENIFENVSKYALPKSRVYIDFSLAGGKLSIQVKNISKDRLNITEEELMERFTRGDKSRTTEGSGLGISIAKSLTTLQNGEFNLKLDGDLFKVVVTFENIR